MLWGNQRGGVPMKNYTRLALGFAVALVGLAGVAVAGSMNGRAGVMPAYYDDQLFTINFKELPSGGESSTLAHNKSINTIYMSDFCMPPGSEMFVSVLDAIQGDGFNPLWNEVQVVFDKDLACMQFTSDTDILDAFDNGLISLVPTDEVCRCSVVGRKKQRARARCARQSSAALVHAVHLGGGPIALF